MDCFVSAFPKMGGDGGINVKHPRVFYALLQSTTGGLRTIFPPMVINCPGYVKKECKVGGIFVNVFTNGFRVFFPNRGQYAKNWGDARYNRFPFFSSSVTASFRYCMHDATCPAPGR